MITIMQLGVKGNQVRFGINAPKTVTVDRHEITERKWKETHRKVVNGNVA